MCLHTRHPFPPTHTHLTYPPTHPATLTLLHICISIYLSILHTGPAPLPPHPLTPPHTYTHIYNHRNTRPLSSGPAPLPLRALLGHVQRPGDGQRARLRAPHAQAPRHPAAQERGGWAGTASVQCLSLPVCLSVCVCRHPAAQERGTASVCVCVCLCVCVCVRGEKQRSD